MRAARLLERGHALAADPERVAAALGLHLLRQAGVRFDMALGMLTEGDPGVVPAARRIAFEPR